LAHFWLIFGAFRRYVNCELSPSVTVFAHSGGALFLFGTGSDGDLHYAQVRFSGIFMDFGGVFWDFWWSFWLIFAFFFAHFRLYWRFFWCFLVCMFYLLGVIFGFLGSFLLIFGVEMVFG
jgi:hypothetical protein